MMFKYSENYSSKESPESTHVYMIGAFPPPVHGMAAVNAAVRDQLTSSNIETTVINIAAKSLDRSFVMRLGRFPTILRALYHMISSQDLHGAILYMSISGGFGKLYEILFLLLARQHGMRIYLHHHSFAYLDRPDMLTHMLIKISGANSIHITQSPGMALRLHDNYSATQRIISLSNVVFLRMDTARSYVKKTKLKTLGYISNISKEKGVFLFLELVSDCEKKGLNLNAILAGPFEDSATEKQVLKQIADLTTVKYVGPVYENEKEEFFADIDVLIFPTLYNNETEGIVNHEVMCRGIPVIAYGRGCISEFISHESGLVVDPGDDFASAAISQIIEWKSLPDTYLSASKAATENFHKNLIKNSKRWSDLLSEIGC